MAAKILFEEKQSFSTQWWAWTMVLFMGAVIGYAFYRQGFGSDVTTQLTTLAIYVFVAAFLLVNTLKTSITAEYIEYSFFPLISKKKLLWKDVESVQLVTYSPLVGYGIRLTFGYGRMYNVAGRKALVIQPKTGRKFSIGTQKPDELDATLQQVFKSRKF